MIVLVVIMQDLRHIFGRNVKYYRFLKGYSQEQLSELTNISPTYLSEIERGLHSVDFDKIISISSNLSIEPFQLFLTPKDVTLPKRIDMNKAN